MLVALSECSQEVPSPGGVSRRGGWVRSPKKFVFCASFHRVLIKSWPPEASIRARDYFFVDLQAKIFYYIVLNQHQEELLLWLMISNQV